MHFSIITITYNSERTLERTLLSVLNQTYQDFEYTIIDGGSSDNTLNIIQKYESKFKGKLTYISEADTGIYNAMNKGVARAKGDWVGIINSDDWYEADALEKMATIIDGNSLAEMAVIHGLIRLYRDNENEFYQVYGRHHNDVLTHGHMIAHPSCFVKNTCYKKYGYFDEDYRIAGDQELMTRLLNQTDVAFIFTDKVIANYKEGGISTQANYRATLLDELQKIFKKYQLTHLINIKKEVKKVSVKLAALEFLKKVKK